MNRDEFAADIHRVEQRLAAGRLQTQHDWNALGAAVARKTSWAPLAIAAAGAAVLVLTMRRGSAPAAYVSRRSTSHRSYAKWGPMLGAVTAIARIVTLPQILALVRTLRNRRS